MLFVLLSIIILLNINIVYASKTHFPGSPLFPYTKTAAIGDSYSNGSIYILTSDTTVLYGTVTLSRIDNKTMTDVITFTGPLITDSMIGVYLLGTPDLDNDGVLDFLIVGMETSGIVLYIIFMRDGYANINSLNLDTISGDGSTLDAQYGIRIYSSYYNDRDYYAAVFCDYDNDGFVDIIISGHTSMNSNRGEIVYISNQHILSDGYDIDYEDTRLTRVYGYGADDHYGRGLSTGDINGDGIHDICARDTRGHVGCIFGNNAMIIDTLYTGGTYNITEVYNYVVYINDMHLFLDVSIVSDFDGDGVDEIGVVMNGVMTVIMGKKDYQIPRETVPIDAYYNNYDRYFNVSGNIFSYNIYNDEYMKPLSGDMNADCMNEMIFMNHTRQPTKNELYTIQGHNFTSSFSVDLDNFVINNYTYIYDLNAITSSLTTGYTYMNSITHAYDILLFSSSPPGEIILLTDNMFKVRDIRCTITNNIMNMQSLNPNAVCSAGVWNSDPVCVEILTCDNYCMNSQICTINTNNVNMNNPICTCNPPFYGVQCEYISPCQHSLVQPPCYNSGSCVEYAFLTYDSGYNCTCFSNDFYGDKCEYVVDQCTSSPCMYPYICNTHIDPIDNSVYYTCDDPCQTNNNFCLHGGICDMTLLNNNNLNNNSVCICPYGFYGLNCEKSINFCDSSPCLNNAKCHSLTNNYDCDCTNINLFGPVCNDVFTDCINTNYCSVYGTCIETNNITMPYKCDCMDGFYGSLCQTSICDSNPCGNYGTCIPGLNYTCLCDYGVSGHNCNIIGDTCTNIPYPCSNHANSCIDISPGLYICDCEAGFIGNTCELPIDSCANSPCANGGTCRDCDVIYENCTYECTCGMDFFGSNCFDVINDCPIVNPCNNHGICNDCGYQCYVCTCDIGYSGIDCEIFTDPCNSVPCLNNGICNHQQNHYNCTCMNGYTGINCEYIIGDICSSYPCYNNGQCTSINNNNDYICTCTHGYDGVQCNNNIDDCPIVNPCNNHGICNDCGVDCYSCTCDIGYDGINCEYNANDPCVDYPCNQIIAPNDNICIYDNNTINNYICNCTGDHYFGPNCYNERNDCSIYGYMCQNNGVCIDGPQVRNYYYPLEFACDCTNTQFTGMYCDQPLCSVQCHNGGQCIETNQGGMCICNGNYSGNYCEFQGNPCYNNPCYNNENCIVVNNVTAICECTTSSIDNYCTPPASCLPNPCVHGTCTLLPQSNTNTNNNGTYYCSCDVGFHGINCEYSSNNTGNYITISETLNQFGVSAGQLKEAERVIIPTIMGLFAVIFIIYKLYKRRKINIKKQQVQDEYLINEMIMSDVKLEPKLSISLSDGMLADAENEFFKD